MTKKSFVIVIITFKVITCNVKTELGWWWCPS